MKKAFTLLELLLVVAIMAFLGVASTSGYSALNRGIKERGAVAAASAMLRSAKERAQIDRSPTAVYCYNRMLKKENVREDQSAVVVGVMTAVRRSGRISYVQNDLLFDEFADLEIYLPSEGSDDVSPSDLEKTGGMRLYYFSESQEKMQYSIVSDTTYKDEEQMVYTFSRGETNLVMSAFYNQKKSSHEPPGWKVGDAYGFEFAEIQLPPGFIFGKQIPTSEGEITTPKVFIFKPDSDNNESIDVWSTKPSSSGGAQAFRQAGKATSDEKEGV